MAELSGRVDILENTVAYLQQDLLLRPDNFAYSSLISNWNNQFNLVDRKYTELNDDVQELQILYANLLVGISSGSIGSSVSGLRETFETINKNLKQYPYKIYYNLSGELYQIYYSISEEENTYITKTLEYNNSGQIDQIILSGNPIPTTNLIKKLLYSGESLTGAIYI